MGSSVRRACLLVFVCSALTASGCSGPCTGTLEEVSEGCPATFDGELATVACVAYSQQQVAVCGGLTALTLGFGISVVHCVYDTSTHALVGAQQGTDVASYCGGTSFDRRAGQVPEPACFWGTPASMRVCSADGGVSDGAAGDAVSE